MLVLSRRPGSAIVIDHHIKVTVEMVAGDDVCLTVECPPEVTVERLEELDVARQLSGQGKSWDPTRMRVLSRRARPTLVINGNVNVCVLAIASDGVRVGVDAPTQVEVHREEVYRQIQQANRSALAATDEDLSGLARYAQGTATGSATP